MLAHASSSHSTVRTSLHQSSRTINASLRNSSLSDTSIRELIEFLTDNSHPQKQLLFNQKVNALFCTPYDFNSEEFAHLRASLLSDENVCELPLRQECKLEKEKGHDRKKGLVTYFCALIEVAVKTRVNAISSNILETVDKELNRTFKTIELLDHRENNTLNEHVAKVLDDILALEPNEVLCYHAGYIGHTIYINFRKFSDEILASIHNLGSGCTEHLHTLTVDNKPDQVYSRGIRFPHHSTQLKDYLSKIAFYADQENEIKALEAIYPAYSEEQKQYDIKKMLRETSQTTGNCVIKNKLFAMRDAIRNKDIYKTIYLGLVEVALNNHTLLDPLSALPSQSDVCNSVLSSQSIFRSAQNTPNPCSEIVDSILICKTQNQETEIIDNKNMILNILLCALVGALVGGLIGYTVANDRNKKMSAGVGTLIGALSGLIAFYATKKPIPEPEPDCTPLPEESTFCYSCRSP